MRTTPEQAATKTDSYVNERTQTGSQEQAIRGAVRFAVAVTRNAVLHGESDQPAWVACETAALATNSRLTSEEIFQAGVYYAEQA